MGISLGRVSTGRQIEVVVWTSLIVCFFFCFFFVCFFCDVFFFRFLDCIATWVSWRSGLRSPSLLLIFFSKDLDFSFFSQCFFSASFKFSCSRSFAVEKPYSRHALYSTPFFTSMAGMLYRRHFITAAFSRTNGSVFKPLWAFYHTSYSVQVIASTSWW